MLGVGTPYSGDVATPEVSNRAALLVPKHWGAVAGFQVSILVAAAIGGFCSWFTMDRAREVNGPVAAGIMVVGSLIIVGFAWYQTRIAYTASILQKYRFYRGMIVAGGISAAMAATAFIGTVVYRDQSGGLNINGEETMMILMPLLAIGVFAEIVAVRNLNGGTLRKQKVDEG